MIPIATHTVTVLRLVEDPERDPYAPQPERAIVARRVRAVISTASGTEETAGGTQEVVRFRLRCDPVDLDNGDIVRDDASGEEYEVQWVPPTRVGYGLRHVEAGLIRVEGVV